MRDFLGVCIANRVPSLAGLGCLTLASPALCRAFLFRRFAAGVGARMHHMLLHIVKGFLISHSMPKRPFAWNYKNANFVLRRTHLCRLTNTIWW